MNRPAKSLVPRALRYVALGFVTAFGWAPLRAASEEIVIPQGTAVDLRLQGALNSRDARVGDPLRATVMGAVWIDGHLALPAGTIVEGRIDVVKTLATGDASAFVGIKFDKLLLSEARPEARGGRDAIDLVLVGRATSAEERDWVSAQAREDARAPGRKATDVDVAAGTVLRMKLGRPLVVPALSAAAVGALARQHEATADRVAAAQRALLRRDLYHGPIDGTLSAATREAIVHFQLDNGQLATGDLDDETSRLLGIAGGQSGETRRSPQANDTHGPQASASHSCG